MDEIAELRNALERLQSALDDLVVRGVRTAGSAELTRMTSLRDEFRSAGAEHLASRLSALIEALKAGTRSAAAELLRAMTSLRLLERMLTLEVAASLLSAPNEQVEEDE
jgi:hypothetical protein